jgi:hypothetical protein
MKLVRRSRLAIFGALYGCLLAAGVIAQQQHQPNSVPVTITPSSLPTLGFFGIGLTIAFGIAFAILFRHGTTAANAIIEKGLTDPKIRDAVRAILKDPLAEHDKDPKAHLVLKTDGIEKVREMIKEHNVDQYAHREALKGYATRAELNGAVARVAREIRYLRGDIRKVDPDKFSSMSEDMSPELEEDFDAEVTGGRRRGE